MVDVTVQDGSCEESVLGQRFELLEEMEIFQNGMDAKKS